MPTLGRSPGAGPHRRSPVQRGVFDHPSHQLIERHARVNCELGHKRSFGHAGLGVDLKTDQPLHPRGLVVITKVSAGHASTAEGVMRLER